MQYRQLGNTGILVSQIGLGAEHLEGKPYGQVQSVIDMALDHGITCMDAFMPNPEIRSFLGRALGSRRRQVVLQGHIGATWQDGQYTRSRDVAVCQHFVQDFLQRFNTDYIDIGVIHFVDTQADFEQTFNGPVAEYARKLKQQGVIRAIGVSSHAPAIAEQMVNTGLIDCLMLSINPAFDLIPAQMPVGLMDESHTAPARTQVDPQRARLYRLCEQKGVGITVMKSLASGRLLNAATSPFGIALTPTQCIHYALTRPAVSSVLVGAQDCQQLQQALLYLNADEQQKSFGHLVNGQHFALRGACMYCNHCLPCPAGIDIAAVHKYLDMAQEGVTPSLKAHYQALQHHGGECIQCGSCSARCPFEVDVPAGMQRAANLFGL